MHRFGLLLAALQLPLVACGTAAAGGGDGLTSHPQGDGALSWESCPRLPPLPSEPPGECSKNRVPLRWAADSSGEIDVVVRRFSPAGARRGTLWVLAGGPGGTGTAFNTPAWRSISVDRGFALLAPMPRGSGLSTPLRCPAEEHPDSDLGALVSTDELARCGAALEARWGDGLSGFTSLEAARDLLHFISREKRPGEKTMVWGGSYGSFWAQRLLEIAPDSVDALILEGLVPPDVNFLELSQNVDEAARELLEQCGGVPGCAAHFTPNPGEVARAVMAAEGEDGGCAARVGVDTPARQRLLAAPFLADTSLRPLVAPLLLRLARCSASDRAELRTAFARFPDLGAPPTAAPSLSGTSLDPMVQNLRLASLIVHADLIRSGRSRETLEALEGGLLASKGQSLTFWREHEVWPASEHHEPVITPTSVPMLMFGGGLDAQTPLSWSRRFAASYAGPHQQLVVVPSAGHMTYQFAKTTSGTNCTVDLWKAFMDDPEAPLDTSCVQDIAPLDWPGEAPETRALARDYLGTELVWGRGD